MKASDGEILPFSLDRLRSRHKQLLKNLDRKRVQIRKLGAKDDGSDSNESIHDCYQEKKFNKHAELLAKGGNGQ